MSIPENKGPHHRVLIVPPDLLGEELKKSFLNRDSFEIMKTENAKMSLSLALSWKPHLVLFSSSLPDLSPYEFCQALKMISPRPKLVMITERLLDDWEEALSADTDGHFTSPVDFSSLLKAIATILEVRQREATRVATDILARAVGLDGESGGRPLMVNLISLSQRGGVVEAQDELKPGSEGQIIFVLPSTSMRLSLPCTVEIILDEIQMHYAVNFTGLDKEDEQALRAFVRSATERVS